MNLTEEFQKMIDMILAKIIDSKTRYGSDRVTAARIGDWAEKMEETLNQNTVKMDNAYFYRLARIRIVQHAAQQALFGYSELMPLLTQVYIALLDKTPHSNYIQPEMPIKA